MNRTKIEYLDYTWNPTTGCGGYRCAVRKKCWALRMAKRLRGRYGYPKENPFEPTFHPDRRDEPFGVKKPSLIGVCFMGDLFDAYVRRQWQEEVFKVIHSSYWHTFLCLTKQPYNFDDELLTGNTGNFWLGVSVNRKEDRWRIGEIRNSDAAVNFVSFEPLYEDMGDVNLEGIDWIIVGAQTRPLIMPKFDWVNSLIHHANLYGIPVFLKNNLSPEWPTKSYQEYPMKSK